MYLSVHIPTHVYRHSSPPPPTSRSILKAEVGQLKATSNGDHKPLEMYLIEKTKALQSENAALKAANAELTGNVTSRRLLPLNKGSESETHILIAL